MEISQNVSIILQSVCTTYVSMKKKSDENHKSSSSTGYCNSKCNFRFEKKNKTPVLQCHTLENKDSTKFIRSQLLEKKNDKYPAQR